MSEASYALTRNRLNLKLRPIFIGQLMVVDSLQHPAFSYNEGEFQVILDADEGITNKFISDYAKSYSKNIFIHE